MTSIDQFFGTVAIILAVFSTALLINVFLSIPIGEQIVKIMIFNVKNFKGFKSQGEKNGIE